MALEIIHQPERELTTFVAKGNPSVPKILRSYRGVKENYGFTKHTLWDGREASFAHLKTHDLLMLDYFIALIQNQCPQRIGGRSSLLSGDPKDAGLFWDFAKFNYRVPQRRQVVLSLDAAMAWTVKGIVPENEIGIFL